MITLADVEALDTSGSSTTEIVQEMPSTILINVTAFRGRVNRWWRVTALKKDGIEMRTGKRDEVLDRHVSYSTNGAMRFVRELRKKHRL